MTKPEPGVRTGQGQGQGVRVGLGNEDWPQSPDQGVKTEVRESQRSKPGTERDGPWPEVREGSGVSG